MYEFLEILDFCGYDLSEATNMAKEMSADIRRENLKKELSECRHVD